MLFDADPIAAHAANRPQAPAIWYSDAAWTWARMESLVRSAATFFDATLAPGATVIVQGWNHPNFIALREAVYRTGRTFGALSPTAVDAEIAHVLQLTGAGLFLRAPEMQPTEAAATPWDVPFLQPPEEAPVRREQANTLLLTSGTTGVPKACLRPVAADAVRMQSMVRVFNLSAAQHHLVAAPLYHSGPSIFQRTHLALGSTTSLLPKFDPAAIWRHVAAGHAQTAFFVPTHYHRLLRFDTGAPADRVDTWWIAGAPASADLKERVIKRLGEGKLWEFLGSSETGTVAVMPPGEHLRRRGSVGRPPPGVSVRILDEAGNDLPVGEVGLIYVKSAMLMDGYLGPDRRQAMWHEGFLSVGDLGRLDDDGYLYLSDRRTDLIISGGVNVYPAEVEGVLLAYPGVQEAAVVGEPDEEWGARVVAVIAGERVDREALSAFLEARLSAAKRPRRIEIWPALPHNAIGKPLRAEVRRLLAERA
jgi:acyl-CoA synthetase (AMP-forming)/AMP-acid ligase II